MMRLIVNLIFIPVAAKFALSAFTHLVKADQSKTTMDSISNFGLALTSVALAFGVYTGKEALLTWAGFPNPEAVF